jgi:hypothetical protein
MKRPVRRGAADRGEHRRAAGAIAEAVISARCCSGNGLTAWIFRIDEPLGAEYDDSVGGPYARHGRDAAAVAKHMGLKPDDHC